MFNTLRFSIFVSQNKNNTNMLQHKNTTVLREIKDFFTTDEKASTTILDLVSSLKLSSRKLGLVEVAQKTYSSSDATLLLLLFPFMRIPNVGNYSNHAVKHLMQAGKDLFYRLKNNPLIDWRSFGYSVTKRLIKEVSQRDAGHGSNPRCLIADDTDLPKKGICIERIGRIFSHVTHLSQLGFKGLFLAYHDGKSLFGLDFTLSGEKGKNEKKPYGLTPKQLKNRFTKKRGPSSSGYERANEYFLKKTDALKKMIRRAIKEGIRFDYLLVDSWFVSESLIKFVLTRRIGFYLLGMAKMGGNSGYEYQNQKYTAKELVQKLKRGKKTKRSRKLNARYATVDVGYKGSSIRLFFCKTRQGGDWNVLLTTNQELDFEEAYRIYSVRWSIEVFFKECKSHLNLGGCQSQDFDAQIADTTIAMLQYNLLSVAKQMLSYQTLGGLFRQIESEMIELTIAEKIWGYLLELVNIITEIAEIELEEVMDKLTADNQKLTKLLNLNTALNAA